MAYWILAAVLIVFGFISGFTIGIPFFLLGLVLVVLGPFRGRPRIFWPILLGVLAAEAVFVGIAPFSCTATLGLGSDSGTTVCTSLFGIRYTGEGIFNPSLQPAVALGLVTGAVVGLAAYVLISRRKAAEGSS